MNSLLKLQQFTQNYAVEIAFIRAILLTTAVIFEIFHIGSQNFNYSLIAAVVILFFLGEGVRYMPLKKWFKVGEENGTK